MLRSARPNDACSAGFVYAGLAPVVSSGWNIDMKSMKTPKSAVWIVASPLVAQLPPRALAHPPHEHRPERLQLRSLRVGVGGRHPRVAERDDARERAAADFLRLELGEEAAHRRRVEEHVRARRLERLPDLHLAAAVDVRDELARREQPDVGAGGRGVARRPEHEGGDAARVAKVRRRERLRRVERLVGREVPRVPGPPLLLRSTPPS